MNTNNLLTLLTSIFAFGLQEVIKEAARQGKTPGELLDSAIAQTEQNARALDELHRQLQATSQE